MSKKKPKNKISNSLKKKMSKLFPYSLHLEDIIVLGFNMGTYKRFHYSIENILTNFFGYPYVLVKEKYSLYDLKNTNSGFRFNKTSCWYLDIETHTIYAKDKPTMLSILKHLDKFSTFDVDKNTISKYK